jgi:hypothetical protein
VSYRNDPIYQTIQWLRSSKPIDVSGSFANAFASVWRDWARIDPLDIRVQVGLVNYKPFERAQIMVTITLVPGRKGAQPVQRHRQLNDLRQVYPFRSIRSGTGGTGHFGPDSEGLSSGGAMSSSGDVCRTAEEIGHLIVDGEEALGLPR